MKALFLGTLAASQATSIIEFITADVRTEILDNNEPAQAAAALADADVLLTGVWRSGFPAAPKLRLLQVPGGQTVGVVGLGSISAFVTPALMGNSRERMAAQQIYDEVLVSFNWPSASSLTLTLVLVTLALAFSALYATRRAARLELGR
jgi:hypothetical protein